MKNLLFGAIAFCLMSFATVADAGSTPEAIIENEPVIENVAEDFIPCLVRDCVYIDGVKYCTDWREAECVIVIY